MSHSDPESEPDAEDSSEIITLLASPSSAPESPDTPFDSIFDDDESDSLDRLSRDIHTCVETSDIDRLHSLLTLGSSFYDRADPDEPPSPFVPPTTRIAYTKVVISRDVELDCVDDYLSDGFTPLLKSISQCNIAISELLLVSGADPNARSSRLQGPLHILLVNEGAPVSDRIAVFQMLLRHGASVQLRDSRGRTPLELCTRMLRLDEKRKLKGESDGNSTFSEGCLRLLVEFGADVSTLYQFEPEVIQADEKEAAEELQILDDYDLYNFEKSYLRRRSFFGPNPGVGGGAESPISPLVEKSRHLHFRKSRKRIRKWRSMLRRLDANGKCLHRKVKSRVRKGIPNSMRGEAWKALMGIDGLKRDSPGLYTRLLGLESLSSKQIDLDINRTFREHQFFRRRFSPKQVALFNVLKAYSIYDPEIGYCQGMSSVTALLLMYVESEEDVFWVLVMLMQDPKWGMKEIFLAGFPKLLESFSIHEKLLAQRLPRLSAHFQKQRMFTSMYATRWFMLMLLDILPFDASIRIWEIFFSEGQKIIYSFSISLLKLLEKDLISKRFEEMIPFLQDLGTYNIDPERLVRMATRRKVKHRHIRRLSREYRFEKLSEERAADSANGSQGSSSSGGSRSLRRRRTMAQRDQQEDLGSNVRGRSKSIPVKRLKRRKTMV